MNDRRVPNGARLNRLYPRNLGYIGFLVSYPRKRVSHNVPPLQDSRLRGNDKVRGHTRVSGPPAHAGLTYRDLKMLHHCKIPACAGMTLKPIDPAYAAVRRIGMTRYRVIPAKAGISKRASIARFPLGRE